MSPMPVDRGAVFNPSRGLIEHSRREIIGLALCQLRRFGKFWFSGVLLCSNQRAAVCTEVEPATVHFGEETQWW
jgi:hypothetical protein